MASLYDQNGFSQFELQFLSNYGGGWTTVKPFSSLEVAKRVLSEKLRDGGDSTQWRIVEMKATVTCTVIETEPAPIQYE